MSRLLTVRTQQKGRCHCPERHAALQLGKRRLVKFAENSTGVMIGLWTELTLIAIAAASPVRRFKIRFFAPNAAVQ